MFCIDMKNAYDIKHMTYFFREFLRTSRTSRIYPDHDGQNDSAATEVENPNNFSTMVRDTSNVRECLIP